MKISVIGSGYVGLVTGTCFSDVGHNVICMDNDLKKIEDLKNGIIPIWEPGLEDLIKKNVKENRLSFTNNMHDAVNESEIIFIAVGTPTGEDGSADLRYVLEAATSIAKEMNSNKIVVSKSTVPVGTADKIKETMQQEINNRESKLNISVVSNPEFLREGAAIKDFMNPDRVVIGVEDPDIERIMRNVYAPFNLQESKIKSMSVRSSEMTKYAANAMLATKISFINEIAMICEHYGADISEVREGIGSDSRIGYQFISPGIGFGGSCFPKDVKALISMAEKKSFSALVVKAVESRNLMQKHVLVDKVKKRFGDDLSGRIFAIWGLSFKPETDDMREAPSIVIINALIEAGADIRAYDPVAQDTAAKVFKGKAEFVIIDDQYKVAESADALLLLTEWKQFKTPDFIMLKSMMKSAIIFDGRNQYKTETLKNLGFEYFSIGR